MHRSSAKESYLISQLSSVHNLQTSLSAIKSNLSSKTTSIYPSPVIITSSFTSNAVIKTSFGTTNMTMSSSKASIFSTQSVSTVEMQVLTTKYLSSKNFFDYYSRFLFDIIILYRTISFFQFLKKKFF